MPIKGYLKSGHISESSIQKAVMEWVSLYPLIRKFIIHIPNEGKRTKHYGKSLKNMGMRPGVSDLFVALQRHGYIGAWIELKSHDGILSLAQKQFLYDMESQNYFTMVCTSIESAIRTLKWYCFEEPFC